MPLRERRRRRAFADEDVRYPIAPIAQLPETLGLFLRGRRVLGTESLASRFLLVDAPFGFVPGNAGGEVMVGGFEGGEVVGGGVRGGGVPGRHGLDEPVGDLVVAEQKLDDAAIEIGVGVIGQTALPAAGSPPVLVRRRSLASGRTKVPSPTTAWVRPNCGISRSAHDQARFRPPVLRPARQLSLPIGNDAATPGSRLRDGRRGCQHIRPPCEPSPARPVTVVLADGSSRQAAQRAQVPKISRV